MRDLLEPIRTPSTGRSSVRALLRTASWALTCGINRPRWVKFRGYEMLLPPDLRGIGRLISTFGDDYDPELPRLLSLVKEGMTVVDVGANVGSFALPLARVVGPHGKVIAIEPLPEYADALRQSVRRNSLEAIIEVVEAAASDRSGLASLVRDSNPARTAIARTTEDEPDLVETLTLDDLVRDVDVLKIDVEGNEELVIAGALNLLRRSEPIVFFEHSPERATSAGLSSTGAWDLLVDLGFDMSTTAGEPMTEPTLSGVCNVVARPNLVTSL